MRTLTFILILFLFSNCSKNKELTTDNPCHQAMKDRFDSELKCTEKDKMEVNLYSGKYKENDPYFPMTMCPSCNTIPPQFGYTCAGQKINISDFNTKVTDIKQIYNSCTKKFVD